LGTDYQAGVGSAYVFKLKPGDRVHATGPFGDFHIKETDREMVYVGGGSGMAPIRSHISYLFETAETRRILSYWYGARSLRDVYYDDYFRGLAKKHSNFSFHVALSDMQKSDNWNSHTGFIHEILQREYLDKVSDADKKEYYLCGPSAMIEALNKLLAQYNVPEEQITFDEF
jgi:Na(+)-translocating NADH:ubiquinone oxidoreductase F subunit